MGEFNTTPDKVWLLIQRHERRRQGLVSDATVSSARAGVAILREAAPRATGDLHDSIDWRRGPGGSAEIIVDAPYAVAVELGCRPHMPPVSRLIEWAEVKGFADPRDVAWRVAIKIREEGIAPTHFVRNSLPRLRELTGANIRYVLQEG